MDPSAVYIFLLTIVSSFIQRTVGFGFGIFIMTMLPLLMPSYGEATTLSGLLALTTSAAVTWKVRRDIQWRKLLPILATFSVVAIASVFCLKQMDDRLLRHILGVVLIITAIWFSFFSQRIHIPATLPYMFGTGTLSGMMGGFFGMQGPPVVLYFLSSTKSKEEYMALVQPYILCGNIIMTVARGYNGFLTPTVGIDYCYGIGGVLIGVLLGSYVFKYIPTRIFQYVVYAYIGISGIIFLIE